MNTMGCTWIRDNACIRFYGSDCKYYISLVCVLRSVCFKQSELIWKIKLGFKGLGLSVLFPLFPVSSHSKCLSQSKLLMVLNALSTFKFEPDMDIKRPTSATQQTRNQICITIYIIIIKRLAILHRLGNSSTNHDRTGFCNQNTSRESYNIQQLQYLPSTARYE